MNQPPVADFTYTITNFSVSFDASSSFDPDGEILVWYWTFGDGLCGQGETIDHTYPQSGTYNVTLTVVDDHSKEDVYTQAITVNPLPFPAFFAGLITDLKYMQDDVMSFKAQCVFFSLFNPIKIGRVIPYEEIWVSNEYRGHLGQKIIVGFFTVIFTEYP
jgi:PKD repeat protein